MNSSYKSISPFSEEEFADFPCIQNSALEEEISLLHNNSKILAKLPISERAKMLRDFAKELLNIKDKIALSITKEMGKKISEAIAEVQRTADSCLFFADRAEEIIVDQHLDFIKDKFANILSKPFGLVLAILPWNFPCSLIARAFAPAFLAGNSVIIKPAPNMAGTTILVSTCLTKAGIGNLFTKTLLLDNEQSSRLISDKRITKITFTGSLATGKLIAEQAGKHIKPVTLELGGNDALLICKDADLNLAFENSFASRMSNCGQVCCAPKRFIVHKSIKEKFIKYLEGQFHTLSCGDPLNTNTNYSPLANQSQRNIYTAQTAELANKVQVTLAKLPLPNKGAFVQPCIIDFSKKLPNTNLEDLERYHDVEIFGPAFSIYEFSEINEAIELANKSIYGLTASIYTNNREHISKFKNEISAGSIFINSRVGVDFRIPFGGVKSSGYGREYGDLGILDWCQKVSCVSTNC